MKLRNKKAIAASHDISKDIPDLWHIAMHILDDESLTAPQRKKHSDMILQVWHKAHIMQRFLNGDSDILMNDDPVEAVYTLKS